MLSLSKHHSPLPGGRSGGLGKSATPRCVSLLEAFEEDSGKYTFVQLDSVVMEQARNLLATYGQLGLRALDSLQLATAVSLRTQAGLFVSADQLLHRCLSQENLPVP